VTVRILVMDSVATCPDSERPASACAEEPWHIRPQNQGKRVGRERKIVVGTLIMLVATEIVPIMIGRHPKTTRLSLHDAMNAMTNLCGNKET